MPKQQPYENCPKLNDAEILAIKEDLAWSWQEMADFLGMTVQGVMHLRKTGITDFHNLGRIVKMSEIAGRGGDLKDLLIMHKDGKEKAK